MKLFKSLKQNYPDCIVTYFNYENHIEKYNHIKDTCLSIGYDCLWNTEIHKQMENFDRRIYFNGEQPCTFQNPDKRIAFRSCGLDNIFTDVYTICPYTAEWTNKRYHGGKEKFKTTIFPIERENILKFNSDEKVYDAIFYGSICGKTHENIVNAIKDFNYKFITLGPQHWHPNEKLDLSALWSKVTDCDITTFHKWDILSKTKIVPIVNHLFLKDDAITSIKSFEGWEDNKVFSNVDDRIMAQLKPRIVEAAFFKMLMLVKRDPWNAIEYFYEPEKEFLYYDDEKELPDIIAHISNNWSDYSHIVDSAYDKAMKNYTTEAVLERMMKETRY